MFAFRKLSQIKSWKAARIVTAIAAAFLALTAVGTASASAAAKPSLTSQARDYGLSRTQISTLQQEVNAYITAHGGRQVAINEVASTGSSIVFAVPGQRFAYPVTSGDTASPAYTGELCPSKAFCTFQKANFEGNEAEYYECNTRFSNKYSGSWKNDQSAGLQALLYVFETTGHEGEEQTCAAYCNDANWSGQAINAVDPC
jgi:hypothetical protein